MARHPADLLPRATTVVAVAVLAGVVMAPRRAAALGEAAAGDRSIAAMGNVRLLGAFLHYPEALLGLPGGPTGDDGLAAGVSRLLLSGSLTKRLRYDSNFFVDVSRVPDLALGGAFATAGSFRSAYRTRFLTWDFWEDGTVRGQLGVDRLAFKLALAPVDLTVGRFPINHSVTRLFTPNDFFAPFSATAINRLYKPGVDAVQVGVALGSLSGLELDAVMGYRDDDTPSWGRSAVLLRASTTVWEIEWALLGGTVAERWIAGASVQGQVSTVGVRAEGHVGFPDRDGDFGLDDVDGDGRATSDVYVRVATGVDYTFVWHNLTIGAEYLFLSDGTGRPAAYPVRALRLFPDDQPLLAEHYAGLTASGEIVPILRLALTGLVNAQDASGLAAVALHYDVADEAALAAGVLIPWGDGPAANAVGLPWPRSELGLMPLMLYLETRVYF